MSALIEIPRDDAATREKRVAYNKKNAYRHLREGKQEALASVEKYLDALNIKHERVLDFICFSYNKVHFRSRSVLDVKIQMEEAFPERPWQHKVPRKYK